MKKTEEEVLYMIRQHPGYFLVCMLYFLFFLVLFLIGFYYFGFNWFTKYFGLISGGYLLYIFSRDYYKWNKTKYLITQKRIVAYEQLKWFHTNMKEGKLENIQMISHEIKGPINHVLNRGNVHIRTSGVDGEEIMLHNIADPYEVEQQISEIQSKYSNTETTNEKSKKKNK